MADSEPPAADGAAVRRILHVDMDAFYASVEQRDDPGLRGRPVAVGGRPEGRGVVAAASYEARVFGVRSAMPMARAVRLCPELVVVPPRFTQYLDVSRQVFDLFREVTPLVEPLSLDEAYLDVTANSWNEPLGMRVAERLKAGIRERTQLTASAGVAPNKFLAKIASGWHKPDGLTVIAPGRVETFLRGLDVEALWGVGPVTARKLRACGIAKLVDVRTADPERLRGAVGSAADWLRQLAQGVDPRPVLAVRDRKSAGGERTFPEDLVDPVRMREVLATLAAGVAEWLTRHDLWTRTVTIKVRYSDFSTVTRSSTAAPAQAADELSRRAIALLERTAAATRPVRLLGVSAHNLGPREPPRPGDWLPFHEPIEEPPPEP